MQIDSHGGSSDIGMVGDEPELAVPYNNVYVNRHPEFFLFYYNEVINLYPLLTRLLRWSH